MTRNFIFVIACLLLPASAFAWPQSLPHRGLNLTFNSGNAPLTVRIIAPLDLISQAVGYAMGPGWCGYRVSWGDGSRTDFYRDYERGVQGEYCSMGLEHIYYRAGMFTVKVIKFHADSGKRVDDWLGKARVLVNKPEALL